MSLISLISSKYAFHFEKTCYFHEVDAKESSFEIGDSRCGEIVYLVKRNPVDLKN